jgi:hypothetical protein
MHSASVIPKLYIRPCTLGDMLYTRATDALAPPMHPCKEMRSLLGWSQQAMAQQPSAPHRREAGLRLCTLGNSAASPVLCRQAVTGA